MSAPRTRRRPTRAAFTLLELMVALTVGGIAITSIYAVGSASSRVFYQQQQVANAQTSLRMAMNQIKRDIARAGYLSTPLISQIGQSCGTPDPNLHTVNTNPLAAITRFRNDVVPSSGAGNDNVLPGNLTDPSVNPTAGFTIDDVVLIGNYETAAEYPGVTLVNNLEVNLSDNWQAFRRDFTNWYDPTPQLMNDTAAIMRTFPANRLIRLRLTNNLYHFARVVSVTNTAASPPDDIRIRFNYAIADECLSAVDGAWIAPVSAIRYVVRNAQANTLNTPRDVTATGRMAQLMREEVLPTDKTTLLTVNGVTNTRAVLDYVVGFNLEFTLTQAFPPPAPPDPDVYTVDQTTTLAPAIDGSPDRIRSAVIDLAVRTPEQDPTFPWSAAACALQRCYRVFDDRPGAARVRRMRAEVFIPNIASEGY